MKKIAILGDYNPLFSTHIALNRSIRQVKRIFGTGIHFDWINTKDFNFQKAFCRIYCGLWIAPGSPYKDMKNVLETITFVRQNNIPTLGNCGGFQHMVLEYARNVCGITEADHEETNPNAQDLLISKLSCSLVGKTNRLTITDKKSILYQIIKKEELSGRYFCTYGINDNYLSILKARGFKPTAISDEGKVHAFEIENHPFFLGTLFQPALTSTFVSPNPIIVEFIRKSIKR